MKKVQEIVRSMPWVVWKTGLSVCHNNVSRTSTKIKRNFKFVAIDVNGGMETRPLEYHDLVAWSQYDENRKNLETALREALEAEGHNVGLVIVNDLGVQVWMRDELI